MQPAEASNRIEDLPQLLTLLEAAKLLRRVPRTLREWRKDGTIETVKIGRAKYIKREEVLRLLGAP